MENDTSIETIRNYKEQMRLEKRKYKERKRALDRERKTFLRLKKEQIRLIKLEQKKKGLTPEERKALRERKAQLIQERRKQLLLPIYSQGEELMNAISHIAGGAFALIATIVGLVFAAPDPVGLTCMAVYGFSMIALYTISSIYHFLPVNKGKQVFQVLDHCTIYVLIAGTYVPVCVLRLAEVYFPGAYIVLGSVVFLSILGVVLNATMMRKKAVKIISNFLYLVIGWLIVFFFPQLMEAVSPISLILFVAGGISYTIGAILYAIGHFKKYFHFIFHLFCLAGTVLQFLGVLFFFL